MAGSPQRQGRACNFTLKTEAAEYLATKSGGIKTRGEYLSILILAERAREEERERLKQQIERVFEEHAP